MFNIYYLFCSEEDIALVLKYNFSTNTTSNSSNKKRKLNEEKVLEYAGLKIPAYLFSKYLENYGALFVKECKR